MDDVIRGVALTHLVTVLFPADSNPNRPHCVGVYEHGMERPPADSAADPSVTLLEVVRKVVPHALPRSGCLLPPESVASKAPAVLARRPIAYFAGRVRRSGASASVPVAYWFHGLNGGGWECDVERVRGRWTVKDCRPIWIA